MKFGGPEGPRRGEAGSAAVEALTATLILCLIFFGLMQIFQWVAGTMIAEYASTYAAGAYARGYTPLFTMRAGRVAAAGISGRDRSTPAIGMKSGQEYIEYRLSSYLENARTSGVDFEYWDGGDNVPHLRIGTSAGKFVTGRVWLDRMPLLHPALELLLRDAGNENGILSGESRFYNYSRHYLEHQ